MTCRLPLWVWGVFIALGCSSGDDEPTLHSTFLPVRQHDNETVYSTQTTRQWNSSHRTTYPQSQMDTFHTRQKIVTIEFLHRIYVVHNSSCRKTIGVQDTSKCTCSTLMNTDSIKLKVIRKFQKYENGLVTFSGATWRWDSCAAELFWMVQMTSMSRWLLDCGATQT